VRLPGLKRTGSSRPQADDRTRRSAFLAEAKGFTPYVAATVGDELFVFRTDDHGVGKAMFLNGWRNDLSGLDTALARLPEYGVHLSDEPMFVDVGANIGTTTVMALRRHGFGSAVSIEPAPENFRTLRINLIANDVDTRVRAIAAAVSDAEGQVSFDVSRPSSGAYRIARADADTAGTVTVDVVTLDGLVARGVIDPERVGLLWVDAVGYEGKVLAGASALLEAGVPAVIAVRQNLRLNPETRAAATGLLAAHYTDVVDLRHLQASYPIEEFGTLLDSLESVTDVLLVRRNT
jgi:FkbM family methyltransferase